MSTNFKGYLIKFNSGGKSTFPHKYLAKEPTFTPDQRLDAIAYRDANADLHRTTINNHKSKLELETIPGLTLEQRIELETDMLQGRLDNIERKYRITYWNDDIDVLNYETGYFYLADISYTIESISDTTIVYSAIKYTFVEY